MDGWMDGRIGCVGTVAVRWCKSVLTDMGNNDDLNEYDKMTSV
jgi:hypothetical protein